MDVMQPKKRKRRRSTLTDVAWGLAALGLSFIGLMFALAVIVPIVHELRAIGVLPPWQARKSAPPDPDLMPAVAVLAGTLVLGPFCFAGVLTGVRARWWMGPAVGPPLAILLSAALGMVSGFSPEEAAAIAIVCSGLWAFCGAAGSLLSWVRRRYDI